MLGGVTSVSGTMRDISVPELLLISRPGHCVSRAYMILKSGGFREIALGLLVNSEELSAKSFQQNSASPFVSCFFTNHYSASEKNPFFLLYSLNLYC